MIGQMVFRWCELIEDSLRAKIDDRSLALGHVLNAVAVGTTFWIMPDQKNHGFHGALVGYCGVADSCECHSACNIAPLSRGIGVQN